MWSVAVILKCHRSRHRQSNSTCTVWSSFDTVHEFKPGTCLKLHIALDVPCILAEAAACYIYNICSLMSTDWCSWHLVAMSASGSVGRQQQLLCWTMTIVLHIQGALHMCCPVATSLHYAEGILHTFDIPYIAFRLLEAIGHTIQSPAVGSQFYQSSHTQTWWSKTEKCC